MYSTKVHCGPCGAAMAFRILSRTPNLRLMSTSVLPAPPPGKPRCRKCAARQTSANLPDSSPASGDTPKTFYRRTLPDNLVALNSSQGKSRFQAAFSAGNADSFFQLVGHYSTQTHPAYCGLTTLTIILNALNVDPYPRRDPKMHPWRWFAESLLESCLDMDSAKSGGVTMDVLAETGRCNGVDVSVFRNMSQDSARNLLMLGVKSQFSFVAVSFNRASLNQTGSGHYSPVAAFDEQSDSVLILDTARFKYGPYWVAFKQLHAATKPADPVSLLPRGYLTFSKSRHDKQRQ